MMYLFAYPWWVFHQQPEGYPLVETFGDAVVLVSPVEDGTVVLVPRGAFLFGSSVSSR